MLWSAWTLEAKLLIVIGCGVVIAISFLIVVCLLIPETWWSCPWSIDRDADDAETVQLNNFRLNTDSCQTTDDDRWKKAREEWITKSRSPRNDQPQDDPGSIDSGRPGSSSNGSSVGTSENSLSACSSRSQSLTTLPSWSGEGRPQIHLTLQLSDIETSQPDAIDRLLIVTIESATDLPARTYMDAVDPSVHLRLERRSRLASLANLMGGNSGGRRNSNQSVLMEDATCPVIYRSRHPRFHHPVTLVVPKSTQLKDCQLVVAVEDKDKLVGKSELGRCRIDLRELDLLAGWVDGKGQQESLVRLSRFLDTALPEEKGAILLGLSFLPTSQRITVSITQCNRLGRSAAGYPTTAVVRLFLLNESGRVLKKRKTAPFEAASSGRIDLNETFHLDVEIERWNRCVVLLVLSRIHQTTTNQKGQLATDDGRLQIRPVYHHAGHVALGKNVSGQAERIHWNSSFQNPRKIISQWHSLY